MSVMTGREQGLHRGADFRGFLVTDVRGRLVGRVAGPPHGRYGRQPELLSVRFGMLRRRCLVPAGSIELIDNQAQVIGLRVDRETVRGQMTSAAVGPRSPSWSEIDA